MRTVVEIEALRLAIPHGDDAWEAGIVSALHQMRRHIERTGNDFREGAPDFDRLHKAFHTSLLAACGSKRLLTAHSDLYDQAYRYRRVMMRGFDSGKKFVAAHQSLADKVLARDVVTAQAMLAAHLRSTLDFVYPRPKRIDREYDGGGEPGGISRCGAVPDRIFQCHAQSRWQGHR